MNNKTKTILKMCSISLLSACSFTHLVADEFKSGIVWPKPPIVDPGTSKTAPSDAIILFDGSDLSKFMGGDNWIIKDGYAEVAKSGITTKQSFGDCQLHVEFATPQIVSGEGQGRGNSGVYLMGKYEIQILDSYNNETYHDGQCGAVYKQQPPMANVSRAPVSGNRSTLFLRRHGLMKMAASRAKHTSLYFITEF